MVNNPYVLSELAVTATNQIQDDLDFPHSGLMKALHQMARGNFAVKRGTGTDLAVSQTVGPNTRTQFDVGAGGVFRDGKFNTVGAGSVELASNQVSRATGQGNSYLLLVITNTNTLALRGDNTTSNKVPAYTEGDVLLALIKLEEGVADNVVNRPMQFLTVTNKEDNSLSIGGEIGGVYTESMSIYEQSSGETVFENKEQDKDILFKVNDGGTTKTLMKFDASAAAVVFENDLSSTLVKLTSTDSGSGSAPDFIMERNSSSPAVNDQLGIIGFNGKDSAANTVEYGRIVGIILDPTDGSESGEIQFSVMSGGSGFRQRIGAGATEVVINESGDDCNFRVEGDTDTYLLFADAGDERVGISTGAPKSTLHVEGSLSSKTRYESAGTAFSVDETDQIIVYNNAATVDMDLPALSTVGDGRIYHLVVLQGQVDIDPNGSENLDMVSISKPVMAGQWCKIVSVNSQSNWFTIGFGMTS